MFFDSHCHLNFPELQPHLFDIRESMRRSQVDGALIVSASLETFGDVHQLALAHDNFWATAGVHPDNEDNAEPTLDDLLRQGSLPKVLAIGETGLDYYRLNGVGPVNFVAYLAQAAGMLLGLSLDWRHAKRARALAWVDSPEQD